MVGNGERLTCDKLCPAVPLRIETHTFVIPCYLLPIEGADVVLGLDWLATLGQVSANFAIPNLSFIYHNIPITLIGKPPTLSQPISFTHLNHLSHTQSIAETYLLTVSSLLDHKSTPLTPSHNPAHDLTQLPREIQDLLKSFPDFFLQPKELPPVRPHDHHINLLPNTKPINVKPYRYPHLQKATISKLIMEMLNEGIIKPSHSPFSSPVLLVKKKDGTWRFCVDYRALNAVTVKDHFPIPTVDELLDELGHAKFFTKLDLRSGYHQIRVIPSDTHKTAFRICDGHYEFLVLPFGLTNAPSIFQSAMNDLLRPYLRQFVLVFFDDILIYSPTFADHLIPLKLIMNLLVTNKFFAKFSKCEFAVSTVHYLGHIISDGVLTPDPEKIKAIVNWSQPRSLSALRGFLGLSGFYRKFIKHYATLAAPLTDLLRVNKFTWTNEATRAFTELKAQIASTPKLHLPDFTHPFQVETDASSIAIGATLQQQGKPLAFFSKKMCARMQHAPTYVRELFAVTEAGKHNTVADSLSRQFHEDEEKPLTQPTLMLAISSLFLGHRLVIPTTTMKQALLTEFHSSPVAGHSGI